MLPNQNSDFSPEGMTLEDVGLYLASAGNHEGKALTLLAMEPGVAYGTRPLHHRFLAIQGETPAYTGSFGIQINYCKNSFEPIGAVARMILAQTLQYELDPEKGSTAQAFAGHLLNLSGSYPRLTLRSLFSATASPAKDKVRSPLRRLEIMHLLETMGSPIDLGTLLNALPEREHEEVVYHIDGMASVGLLSTDSDRTKLKFNSLKTLCDASPETEHTSLTYELITILYGLIESDISITSDAVESRLRENPKYSQQKGLRHNMHAVLNDLTRQGYLEKEGPLSSKITLNYEQKKIISGVLHIVRGMQDGGPFKIEGLKIGEKLIANPNRVKPLIAKAYSDSPSVNALPREQRVDKVRKFLLTNSGAVTGEIIERLEQSGMSPGGVRDALQAMEKAGSVTSSKNKRTKSWFLV